MPTTYAAEEPRRKTGTLSCPQGQEKVDNGRQASHIVPEANFLCAPHAHPHGKQKCLPLFLAYRPRWAPNVPDPKRPSKPAHPAPTSGGGGASRKQMRSQPTLGLHVDGESCDVGTLATKVGLCGESRREGRRVQDAV